MERLRSHITSLELKWEILQKKDPLLTLHRTVSHKHDDDTKQSVRKKKVSITITDIKQLNFDPEYDHDQEVISDLLVAWETLLQIVRDIQLVMLLGDFSKNPQQQKKMKSYFQRLQDIVDRKRCEKSHPELKDAIARVPLDIRACKWTKVVSIVPKGLEYTHKILAVINTYFPDTERFLEQTHAADLPLTRERSQSDRRSSDTSLDFPPVVTIRRSFSVPGLRPEVHRQSRIDHFSAQSGTSSVVNINFSSLADVFSPKVPCIDEMDERMAVMEIAMDGSKQEIDRLQSQLYECRKDITYLEIEAKLRDFQLKETMNEVQRLGGSKLRPPITDLQMEDIAGCLRDDIHIRLASVLDIDLAEIEHDYPTATCGLREVKVQILRKWREREGEGGTLERLIHMMVADADETMAGTVKNILDDLIANT